MQYARFLFIFALAISLMVGQPSPLLASVTAPDTRKVDPGQSIVPKAIPDVTPEIGQMLAMDADWSNVGSSPFESGSNSNFILKVQIGSAVRMDFPKKLDASHPIIIKTAEGSVKQFLGSDETFSGQVFGKYLVYRGTTRSILFRYDAEKKIFREFVYLANEKSLQEKGTVIRWRFEGANLKGREDGTVVLLKKIPFQRKLQSIAERELRQRVHRFILEGSGLDEAPDYVEKSLFIIPPPEYIDGTGQTLKQGLKYSIADNSVRLAFKSTANLNFPIWADPSFTADTDAEVIFRGDTTESLFGFSVGSGDFNGDETTDVIVGAYNDSTDGTSAGRAFVFLGRSISEQTVLKPLTEADVILTGEENSFFGFSVASAGDFNGDGREDIIVGAPYADRNDKTDSGAAYIFYGLPSFSVGSQMTLSANTDAKIIIEGQDAGDLFGFSVASAGNFQGDGDSLHDVIVGAPEDDNNDATGSGSAFIYYGINTVNQVVLQADTHVNVRLDGQGLGSISFDRFNDEFGWSVASAGDFNNDGNDDVIVGAPGDDNSGDSDSNVFDDSGAAFIFFGANLGTQTFKRADADADIIINSTGLQDNFGFSVAGVGDFNGDSFDDVIVGAPLDDNNGENMSGSAFIFFGQNPGMQTTLTPDSDANIILNGQSELDRFGWSVAGAGDFNGDSLKDVIVGAPKDSNNSQTGSGAAFVFFGQNPGMQTTLRADADADLIINGQSGNSVASEQGDELGVAVGTAGDFNGVGANDVLVGAWLDDANGSQDNSGAAFIFYGLSVSFDKANSDGLESVTNVTIPVSLNIPNPLPANVTIDYAVNGMGTTAQGSGTDFTLAAGTLTFANGVQTQDITLTVVDDALDNDDGSEDELENIVITLSNGSNTGLGSIASHTYTIIDNDGDDSEAIGVTDAKSPTIYFESATSSGSESNTTVNINVKLSNAADNPVGTGVSVSNGTATENTDFTLDSNSVMFLAGETSKTVTLTITDDSVLENNETIEIILSAAPSNGAIGIRNKHTYTILDDDAGSEPTVSFAESSSSKEESDHDPDFTVSLSHASGEMITVDFSVSDQTVGRRAFTLNTGTLTFNPGITSVDISATVVDNAKFQGDETVVMQLRHPVNATIGSPSSHTYTIIEDDPPPTYGIISPYWQTDSASYTFIATSHPSLSGMGSQIGVIVDALFKSGISDGKVEFTISQQETQRIFIVATNNPSINPDNIPDAKFIITDTTSGRFGNVRIAPIATNVHTATGNFEAPGFLDITLLNFWGAVVVQNTSTGFAMEFIGDTQDSRSFNTPNFSGIN